MKTCICPGSFDPVTRGHIDIIKRAALIFDKVYVAVLINSSKKTVFTVDERVEMLKKSLYLNDNITIEGFSGLLSDYAKMKESDAIVKGLRSVTDFENEFQMSLINKKLNPNVDTIFLNTKAEYMYLSSNMVKEVAFYGGDITDFVPPEILEQINSKFEKTRNEN